MMMGVMVVMMSLLLLLLPLLLLLMMMMMTTMLCLVSTGFRHLLCEATLMKRTDHKGRERMHLAAHM